MADIQSLVVPWVSIFDAHRNTSVHTHTHIHIFMWQIKYITMERSGRERQKKGPLLKCTVVLWCGDTGYYSNFVLYFYCKHQRQCILQMYWGQSIFCFHIWSVNVYGSKHMLRSHQETCPVCLAKCLSVARDVRISVNSGKVMCRMLQLLTSSWCMMGKPALN